MPGNLPQQSQRPDSHAVVGRSRDRQFVLFARGSQRDDRAGVLGEGLFRFASRCVEDERFGAVRAAADDVHVVGGEGHAAHWSGEAAERGLRSGRSSAGVPDPDGFVLACRSQP
ncbi:MAG TPA: hypothetical protein VFU81_05895, partial [Thermomicrobiales bacterium]|nr:hypothetical protein [Thermomicrobiales bacterium]